MVEISYVLDYEELYRSVRSVTSGADEYYYNDERKLVIRSKAFNDKNREPSVDRAVMRDFHAEQSKKSDSDGIVSLITEDIRRIAGIKTEQEVAALDQNKLQTTIHNVDVLHKPIEDNHSHSVVTVDPVYLGSRSKQDKTFDKVKTALAKLASERGWAIQPNEG